MTGNVDIRGVVTKSAVLAALGVIATIPYFHYLVFAASSAPIPGTDGWTLVAAQLVLVLILLFLSALIGFSFATRLDLPGLGEVRAWLKGLPILIPCGFFLVALSYFAFDRYFLLISPASFPTDPVYLAAVPFKGAFVDETVLRLGLVTIGVGLVRDKAAGVIVTSAVASLFTIKYFEFIGMPFALDPLFVVHLLLSFLGNLLLGWLFVTRGLLWSMTLTFVLDLKYLFILWMGA
jgi:hypothetical protein